MTQIQNSKQMIRNLCAKWHHHQRIKVCAAIRNNCGECFGNWILKFEIYLLFGTCDLGFKYFIKPSHSTGLGFALTLPCRSCFFL